VTNKAVVVIGMDQYGIKEAEFLRSYTRRIAPVASDGPHELDEQTRYDLAAKGIDVLDGLASNFALHPDGIAFQAGALWLPADRIYPGARTQYSLRA
jgi:thioredoxin reductase (NADPH)